ncbi:MAG: hypothetical protein EBY28_03880 [Betaproteobacteria bacterium]|nr:hypothetical protein [Betaproteobacteria bacterium]
MFHRLRQGFGVCIVGQLGLPGTAGFAARAKVAREALNGQPHKLVRHPDMPAEAFPDLSATRIRAWLAYRQRTHLS